MGKACKACITTNSHRPKAITVKISIALSYPSEKIHIEWKKLGKC